MTTTITLYQVIDNRGIEWGCSENHAKMVRLLGCLNGNTDFEYHMETLTGELL